MSESNPYQPPATPAAPASAPAGAFSAAGRAVDAGRGWSWIADGWELFARQPVLWVVNGFVFSLVVAVLPYVPPVLGFIASTLVTPVILGGLMLGSQAVQGGQPLTFGHLFAGFQKNVGLLLSAGLVWLFCLAVIGLVGGGVMGFGIFKAITAAMTAGDFIQNMDSIITIILGSIITILLGFLIMLALLVPVTMMLWFTPALIVFHDMGVGAALKTSFVACLKNIIPFLLYGLAMLVLWFVAFIPLMLGVLVLVPVLIASVYTSYRDIFFVG